MRSEFVGGIIGLFYCLSTAFAGDRLSIDIFSYSTVGTADATVIETLLRQKVEHLAEQTISAHPDLIQLNKIKVVNKRTALPASPEALAKYWADSAHTLEIFSGTIFSNPYAVTSDIYLGALQGSLSKKTVTVEASLSQAEFRSYRDMHGALMLYALAMNAKASVPQQRGVISQYLAEAESLLKDIRQRPVSDSEGNVQAVQTLSKAVAKEIAALER